MTAMAEPAVLLGHTQPRLYTAPLVEGPPGPCGCGCALTPATSRGFQAVAFAEQVLGLELCPWQRWWLIHAFELLADGTLRFRTILTLIARQNGKTTLLKVVALWMLYMGHAQLVLGAAQTLEIAKEAWEGAVGMARAHPALAAEIPRDGGVRRTNGDVRLTLASGARYKITATGDEAGRGLSVDLLVLDELRAQRDTGAWAALSKTTSARRNGLIVGISNAGSDLSVVLNRIRATALAQTEPSVGLFEWSAPDGCDLDDPQAWAAANPALGRGLSVASIRTSLATDPPDTFRTEVLCQHVPALDSAIDAAAWRDCADKRGDLSGLRDRLAMCLDVSLDGRHVTLAGAARVDEHRVRVEVFAAWSSIDAARRELGPLLEQIRPADIGWFPNGPAAAVGADLRALRRTVRRALAKVVDGRLVLDDEEEFTRLVGAMDREACQGFAALVDARQLLQPADPLLDAHVAGAAKVTVGDGWRFTRQGVGHVDAVYAAAGAVYLAQMLPLQATVPRPKAF